MTLKKGIPRLRNRSSPNGTVASPKPWQWVLLLPLGGDGTLAYLVVLDLWDADDFSLFQGPLGRLETALLELWGGGKEAM